MNVVLIIITSVILGVSILLLVGAFLNTLFNYRTVRKRIQYDQKRSEKGEVVLLKDSFLNEMFYYADKDFTSSAPPADPLGIYSPLLAAKWIFTLSQVILIITLVGVGVALFMTLTGNEADAESDSRFKQFIRLTFPMMMSVFISIIMIVYITAVYKKLYINQIWPQIQANQVKLNALHTVLLGSVVSTNDAAFLGALNNTSVSLNELHKEITQNAQTDAIVKRLVMLSLRDYFMTEVPSYESSPIRELFSADASKRPTQPGLYIRIDCSQTVQNYAYKYNTVLNPITDKSARANILASVSAKLNEINRTISTVRLESQPMVALLENFFRISTYYFFFMVVIVSAIVIGWYNLGCYIKVAWLWLKYNSLKVKVKLLPAKKDADGTPISNYKETQLKELEQDYMRESNALSCKKTSAPPNNAPPISP